MGSLSDIAQERISAIAFSALGCYNSDVGRCLQHPRRGQTGLEFDMASIASERLCGVYLIRCNGKVYVGSSINITARWYAHRTLLRANRHTNPHLQNAWNKYGASAFVFEILELCLEVVRTDRENYWIHKLKAADREHGYNLAPSAIDLGIKSDESRAKTSAAAKAMWDDPDQRASISAAISAAKSTPESHTSMSAITTALWEDPEYRANVTAAVKAAKSTPEARAQKSKHAKSMWQDPEYRKQQVAAMRAWQKSPEAREQRRAAMRARWDDPEYRAVQSAAMKARWQAPAYQAKQKADSTSMWARRKAQEGEDHNGDA